jgi:hypothetical protein
MIWMLNCFPSYYYEYQTIVEKGLVPAQFLLPDHMQHDEAPVRRRTVLE